MKQHDRQCETGAISTSIIVTLDYSKTDHRKTGETTAHVVKEVRLESDPAYMDYANSHTRMVSGFLNFQRGANKLMRQVKKLLEAGQFLEVSIIAQGYERAKDGLNPLFFNSWTFEGSDLNGAADETGIHFTPDSRYTDETHDIWAPWGQDFMQSLEDAGI